jgi:hypothetical protein
MNRFMLHGCLASMGFLMLIMAASCSESQFQSGGLREEDKAKPQEEIKKAFNAEGAGAVAQNPKVEFNAGGAGGAKNSADGSQAPGSAGSDNTPAIDASPNNGVDNAALPDFPNPNTLPPDDHVVSTWNPDEVITSFFTLERCKWDLYKLTGDMSLCWKCYYEWKASGGKITPRRCGCYQETVVTQHQP